MNISFTLKKPKNLHYALQVMIVSKLRAALHSNKSKQNLLFKRAQKNKNTKQKTEKKILCMYMVKSRFRCPELTPVVAQYTVGHFKGIVHPKVEFSPIYYSLLCRWRLW